MDVSGTRTGRFVSCALMLFLVAAFRGNLALAFPITFLWISLLFLTLLMYPSFHSRPPQVTTPALIGLSGMTHRTFAPTPSPLILQKRNMAAVPSNSGTTSASTNGISASVRRARRSRPSSAANRYGHCHRKYNFDLLNSKNPSRCHSLGKRISAMSHSESIFLCPPSQT